MEALDALELLAGAADATVAPGEASGAEADASAPDDSHARCLDVTHALGCTECVAAPPFGEEGLYELSGDPGRKNGASPSARWGPGTPHSAAARPGVGSGRDARRGGE